MTSKQVNNPIVVDALPNKRLKLKQCLWIVLFCIVLCMVLCGVIGLVGCNSANPAPPTTPPTTVTPIVSNPPPRGLVSIDIEIDTRPLYSLGDTVTKALADKIDTLATRVNSAGMVIFVCRISSQSWQDCPVSFQTPAIPAWVLPPPDPAIHCSPDPFQCSKQKRVYKKDYADWLVVHNNQVNALAQTTAYVHTLTDKIRHLDFKHFYDNKGSDIWNALATCASNLQGINAPYKFCLMATDWIETSPQNGTLQLRGIRVASTYRTCANYAACQHSDSYWATVCRRAGAVSFDSYSVPQSQALGLELPE